MSVYKRGDYWYIDVRDGRDRRIRRRAGKSRRDAEALAARVKIEIEDAKSIGEPKPRRTWDEAAVRYVHEGTKRRLSDDINHLKWLGPYLAGRYIDEIGPDEIATIREARAGEGVSVSTVNHTLKVVRQVLNKAHKEWQWLDAVPFVRMLPQEPGRVRWLTRDEADRLIAEVPYHLSLMVRFSLATGLRQSNVTGLVWSQVNLDSRVAWINPDQTKAKRAIHVPLNNDAVVVLRECHGDHREYVFSYKGSPVTQVNTKAFRSAVKRAGIEPFRWHDLRHTWASWHVQAGTPLQTLMELGGWHSYTMVLRYAHLAPAQHVEAAEAISTMNQQRRRA